MSVDPASLPRRAAPPGMSTTSLAAGEARTVLLGVRRREIALLDARGGAADTPEESVEVEAESGRK